MKATEEAKRIILELTEDELTALRVSVFKKEDEAKENFAFWTKMARKSEGEGGLTHEKDVKHVEYWRKELETIESVHKKLRAIH